MYPIEELTDFVVTANFGKNRDLEVQSEVMLSILVPKKSIPYYREYGSIVQAIENTPITILRLIELSIDIIQAVQRYNEDLTSSEERRVSVLPDSLDFDDSNKVNGEISVQLVYTPLWNLEDNIEVTT
jgi:hypothetical protein